MKGQPSSLWVFFKEMRIKIRETLSHTPQKTYSTLRKKKFIPLYAEDLHFLIKRTGWLVIHIYEHYTFHQSKFKKDFVVMNQKSRQQATSSVERDSFKLLKNSNFVIDCRNNIDNYILEPLYDDLSEISYIKKFTIIFSDNTFWNFFSPVQHTWDRRLLEP